MAANGRRWPRMKQEEIIVRIVARWLLEHELSLVCFSAAICGHPR
jgi:hypothetical protein